MKALLTVFFAAAATTVSAQTHDITITMPNIKNSKGTIHAAVYSAKNKSSFTKEGQEYKVLNFKNKGAKEKYVIKGLPEGEYAFAFYHDENDDKKCNTNLIGIPKEGYGFTRLQKVWSIPKFDDCSLLLDKDMQVSVTLIY